MKLSLSSFPAVKGIFVGGCIERGEGSSFRRKAHAHNHKTDPLFGWVCVRSWRRVGIYTMEQGKEFDGSITKPSMLILHEVAHILAPNQGHNDTWRNRVKEIGGRINSWEKKGAKKRTRHSWQYYKDRGNERISVCKCDGGAHYKFEMTSE